MGHVSATLSQGAVPRRRSVVGVALLSVCAVFAAACGSADTSGSSGSSPVPVGAQENAVTSADWGFQLLTPDGMVLPVWRADDGTEVNGYLVSEVNQLRATVPAEVLASATDIVLEVRTPDGVWNDSGSTLRVVDASGTPMRLPVNASGTAEGTFNGGGAFVGPHEFRLKAQTLGRNPVVVGYSNVVQATGFATEPVTVVPTSGEWGFEMQKMDGTPLDEFTTDEGVVKDLIVYDGYRFEASVPVELVTATTDFVVEGRMLGSDVWLPRYKVQVNADGTASGTFHPNMERQVPMDYRMAAVDRSRPTYTVIAMSESVRAAAQIEFSISLVNNTSNDLTVKIPMAYDAAADTWTTFDVKLDQGQTRKLVYENPPNGTGFSMILNKQRCFLDCTDYFMDWTWSPDTRTACASLNSFLLFSSAAYTVTLSDNVDGQSAGFKTGTIDGPMLGPGTDDTSCTFTTRTRDGQWLANHPVKGAFTIIGIAALVIVTVFVTGVLIADAAATTAAAEAVASAERAAAERAAKELAAKEAAELAAQEARDLEEVRLAWEDFKASKGFTKPAIGVFDIYGNLWESAIF
ncbi:MAG: hypothetical protein RI958_1030 [Actinomycetota bacterium]|jgi:hypothetical protein